jgi:hypothetical protein
MTEIQEIDVYVDRDGIVKVGVRGVKGPGCLALTADLERLLGGQVVERTTTDELSQEAQLPEEDRLREKT